MANERTVFQRLLRPEEPRGASLAQRKAMIVDSIIEHLRGLLNSRRGCTLANGDFGLPDLNTKRDGTPATRAELENQIRETIQHFEPRLRRVQVRMDEPEAGVFAPRFIITAQLAHRDDFPKDVSFTTVIDPTGKFDIK